MTSRSKHCQLPVDATTDSRTRVVSSGHLLTTPCRFGLQPHQPVRATLHPAVVTLQHLRPVSAPGMPTGARSHPLLIAGRVASPFVFVWLRGRWWSVSEVCKLNKKMLIVRNGAYSRPFPQSAACPVCPEGHLDFRRPFATNRHSSCTKVQCTSDQYIFDPIQGKLFRTPVIPITKEEPIVVHR